MKKRIVLLPLTDPLIETLHAGDQLLLTGELLVARDAAHKRMCESLDRGESLPVDLSGESIYYMGPSPAPQGHILGAAGPTTSHRMDAYTPELLKRGLKGMIGKGNRTEPVKQAIPDYKAVYMAAVGGAGALLSDCIKQEEIIAYEELGPEALRKISVEEFPVIVVIDAFGNNLYEQSRPLYEGAYSREKGGERI